jgi:hypothetical protein
MEPVVRAQGAWGERLGRIAGAGVLAAFAVTSGLLATAPAAPPRSSLVAQAAAVAGQLEEEVDAALGLLGPLRGRLRAGEVPDWKVFDELVAKSPLRRATQELVAWVPRVPAATRAAFEAESGRDAFRTFRIVEPGRESSLVPAQRRAQHHPVALAAPLQPAAELLGLDLEATPELELALSRTGNDLRPTLAGPLALLPAASCTVPDRPGCAPQIFLVVPVAAGRTGGFLLVGLSWPAITQAGLARAVSAPAGAIDWLQPRAARASFRVQRTLFTVELRAEPGRPLTARLGHAAGDAQAQ